MTGARVVVVALVVVVVVALVVVGALVVDGDRVVACVVVGLCAAVVAGVVAAVGVCVWLVDEAEAASAVVVVWSWLALWAQPARTNAIARNVAWSRHQLGRIHLTKYQHRHGGQ